MSHNVTISNVKIRDISAVRQAVSELASELNTRMELKENAVIRSYASTHKQYGNEETAEYVIHMADFRYDVGLTKNSDGSYSLRAESASSGDFGKVLGTPRDAKTFDGKACYSYGPGAACGRLVQRINTIVAEKEATQMGLTTTRQVDAKTSVMNLIVDVA